MKVKARANGNVIDLPDDHSLIGVLYDPVEDEPKAKSTKVEPLTTKDVPKGKKK